MKDESAAKIAAAVHTITEALSAEGHYCDGRNIIDLLTICAWPGPARDSIRKEWDKQAIEKMKSQKYERRS